MGSWRFTSLGGAMKAEEGSVKDTVKYVSDGSTASYYVLPDGAKELQDLISARDMNAQIGEIFRACYRYGLCRHSDKLRDAKKILFYAQAEVARLEALEASGSWAEGKPDWGSAPKWAQWLAQDENGEWWWHELRPALVVGSGEWASDDQEGIAFAGVTEVVGDWRDSLEGRPVEEVE